MKTILASLTGTDNDEATLETARLAALRFGSEVSCLHVRRDFPTVDTLIHASAFTRQHPVTLELAEFERAAEAREETAHRAFNAFLARHAIAAGGRQAFEWRRMPGEDPHDTMEEARYFDLTIVGRQTVHEAIELDRIGTIALGSGRPLLIAPPVEAASLADTIAIAWKNKPEAARAVVAAAPFLGQARRVVVATVGEDDDAYAKACGEKLAAQLRRAGLPAEAKHTARNHKHASHALLDAACAVSADLLVMGAYGHSRMREMVFGGVTRDLILEAAPAVLMFH